MLLQDTFIPQAEPSVQDDEDMIDTRPSAAAASESTHASSPRVPNTTGTRASVNANPRGAATKRTKRAM